MKLFFFKKITGIGLMHNNIIRLKEKSSEKKTKIKN